MRELCLIAIEEKAFDVLVAKSGLKAAAKSKPSAEPDSAVLGNIAWLKSASVEQNLLASISRACGRAERHDIRFITLNQPAPIWRRFRRCHAIIWLLVSYTYKFHKKGDLEPDLPFLCISGSSEIQGAAPQNVDGAATLADDGLEVSNQGAVLIHGDCHRHLSGRSKTPVCVYLVRESPEPPNQEELGLIIKRTFEDHDVYHTTRDYGTLNPRNVKESHEIWNLASPYGVFYSYGRRSFVKWLRRLGEPLPTRQGSPRGRHATGRVMFEREYSPWHDPRLIYGIYRREKKKFFKRLFVAEVTAWARIAQERIRQGNDCCTLCATVDPGRLNDFSDFEFEFEEGDRHDGSSNDGLDLASTPLPSSQNQDQGGDFLPRSERDTKSQTDSEEDLTRIIKLTSDLCASCQRDVGIWSKWPAWLKKVIMEALGKAISAAATDDAPASDNPEGYCFSTPPRRPWRSRLENHNGSYIYNERSSPSDSETESENADLCLDEAPGRLPHEDLGPDDVVEHAEDQADGPNSTLASASPPRGKRALSTQSDGETALKRRKGSVPRV